MAHHGKMLHEAIAQLPDEIGEFFNREREAEFREKVMKTAEGEGVRTALSKALLDTTGLVGATGHFPQGKMDPSDEGGVQFRVGSQDNKVILDFGSPVVWVGMDAQQAADLASSLLKWAKLVGRRSGETITVDLGAV